MRYYLFGKEIKDIATIQKIEKKSEKCMWHLPDDNLENDFIGFFTEKGECYDNCCSLGAKSWSKWSKLKQKNRENFEKFKERLNFSIDAVNNFITTSDNIQNLESTIKNKKKILEDGYIFMDTKIGGSKKKRRFKKDNRRFLVDKELDTLKKEIETLKLEHKKLSETLKLEETLEKVIESSYYIDIGTAREMCYNFRYGETVFLYNFFVEMMKKLNQKVNDLEYNKIKSKNKDIKNITIFEESYAKIYKIVKENKSYEEKTKNLKEREVTKKAMFYIDENGELKELNKNIKQSVINLDN